MSESLGRTIPRAQPSRRIEDVPGSTEREAMISFHAERIAAECAASGEIPFPADEKFPGCAGVYGREVVTHLGESFSSARHAAKIFGLTEQAISWAILKRSITRQRKWYYVSDAPDDVIERMEDRAENQAKATQPTEAAQDRSMLGRIDAILGIRSRRRRLLDLAGLPRRKRVRPLEN